MSKATINAEADLASWLEEQLNFISPPLTSTERDLENGCAVLRLLNSWGLDGTRIHHKPKDGNLSCFHAADNRSMIYDILATESKRLESPIAISKHDIFGRHIKDTVRLLHAIYQNRCLFRGKISSSEDVMKSTTSDESTVDLCDSDIGSEAQAPLPLYGALSVIQDSVYGDGKALWRLVQEERVLRVFMSSTFRDMQKERDEFFNNAEKKLKDFANKKGIVLVFIDLRWGLTKDISESGLVVISCLESIENCPYFMCTLGSRYGWCPNHKIYTEWHTDTDTRYPYISNMRGLSVTEYEIIHGALRDSPIARRAVFFSRDEEYAVNYVADSENERVLYRPVDEKDKCNQDKLKKKISTMFQLRMYRTPKELVEMTTEFLVQSIIQDFPETEGMCPEDLAHDQYMRHRLIGFCGREAVLKQIHKTIEDTIIVDSKHLLVLGAESGIGKSSIMSKLVLELKEKEDVRVIYHFAGCTNMSNYVDNLLERIMNVLAKMDILNIVAGCKADKHMNCKGLSWAMDMISAKANERNTKVVIVIDAINQFVDSQTYTQVQKLNWLPKKIPKNVHLVVSTIDSHETFQTLKSLGLEPLPISRLDADGITSAAKFFLGRYNKSLSISQIDLIVSDIEDTGHPLYLRLLLDELRIFGTYESVDTELSQLLSTKGVTNLYSLIIKRWEKKYGSDVVRFSICVLWISRIGLNENELDEYVRERFKKIGQVFDPVSWKCFLFVLLDSLFIQNGRYTFTHQLLRESVQNYFFDEVKHLEMETGEYSAWLLKERDVSLMSSIHISEACYALHSSKKYDELASFLKNEKVVFEMLEGNYRYEFFVCWRTLNKHGFDHKVVYEGSLKELTHVSLALVGYFREIHENEFIIPIIEHRIAMHTCDGDKIKDLIYLGRVLEQTGRFDQARLVFEETLRIGEKCRDESSAEVAMAHNGIGCVLYSLGKYEDALNSHMKSLEIRLNLFGDYHQDVSMSYNNLGNVYFDCARYEEAMDTHIKSMNISIAIYGDTHPDVANSLNNIGNALRRLGRFEEALDNYKKSLDIRLFMFDSDHPHVATSYNNIGNCYLSTERFEEAIQHYKKAQKIQEKYLGESHPDVASCYSNIGSAYYTIGKFKQALTYHQKAHKIYSKVYGEGHITTGNSFYNIGNDLIELGSYQEAIFMFEKAKVTYASFYGEEHSETKDLSDWIESIRAEIENSQYD